MNVQSALALLTVVALGACAAPPAPSRTAALAQRSALEAMTPEAQSTVRAANVRFLLLPEPYARVAVATSGPHWSALSAREGSLTVSLHGTDVTHDAALPLAEVQRAEPPAHVRGVAARVLVNEGIRSVAWNEDGADWSLEVECFAPDTDARCTDDAFVLDLASRLEEMAR